MTPKNVVQMSHAHQKDPFDLFVDRVKKTKKITKEVVRRFCSIRSEAKTAGEQKKDLADVIKEVMVENDQSEAKFDDCPFMLTISEVKYKKVTEVNWEKIASALAARQYGSNWRKNDSFRTLKRKNTSVSQQPSTWRLNEPEPNPDYED